MSGICGIVHCDGRAAAHDDIAPILAGLAARGPDGARISLAGSAALGHALLATTPEALVEPLPFIHAETGCVLTADLRLDNRAELLAALGLGGTRQVIGDGELVMAAYLKWGPACPAHLDGDFALALWDPRHRRLFCARDRAAMRPLIYHYARGRRFAFSSDALALLRHPAIPCRINAARIADFAENRESFDFTSTFFEDIHRLPPAHALTLENGMLRTWCYWQLEPQPRLDLPSDDAYAEAFLEVFTRSVRDRLRSAGPVGSMLSGGMDSGSVAAVAAQLLKAEGAPPLATFSAVSTDPSCIETRTIRLSQTMDHIDPVSISLEDFDDYGEDLAALTRQLGEPFDTMPWNRAVYLAARRRGIKVVLDGGGGDTTLHADTMVAWHLRRGRLIQAWREARGERRFDGPEISVIGTLLSGARHVVVPQFLRDVRRRLTAERRHRSADRASPLAAAVMERVDNRRRRDVFARAITVKLDGRHDDRRDLVLHRYVLAGRERYDRIAGQAGIEARDPFLDRRLLEFSLALPPDQMQRDGWPKIILRRAMAGLLPDGVRWRVGKEHVGWEFEDALIASGLIEPTAASIAEAAAYFRSAGDLFCNAADNASLAVALDHPLRYTALWMDQVVGNFGRSVS